MIYMQSGGVEGEPLREFPVWFLVISSTMVECGKYFGGLRDGYCPFVFVMCVNLGHKCRRVLAKEVSFSGVIFGCAFDASGRMQSLSLLGVDTFFRKLGGGVKGGRQKCGAVG